MALVESALPYATPYDPAEDPPGSIDPLGTLAGSERLADRLLPGLTSRMWRARLLTATTLIAWLADELEREGNGTSWVEFRLALERFFVTALVQHQLDDGDGWESAVRAVPGRAVVKRALQAREPVTRRNFLKGPRVNGPFGVMATLARELKLLDSDDRPGPAAMQLLEEWVREQRLDGLLDETLPASVPGRAWLGKVTRAIKRNLDEGTWPSRTHLVWTEIADRLRPDRIAPREGQVLSERLHAHPVRSRVIAWLIDAQSVYADARSLPRFAVERVVIREGLLPRRPADDLDRVILNMVEALDSYLEVAGLLYQGFDALRWGLTRAGGGEDLASLIASPPVEHQLSRVRSRLQAEAPRFEQALNGLHEDSWSGDYSPTDRLRQLHEDALGGLASNRELAVRLLERHERVSRAKDRAPWIERGPTWMVLPGYGLGGDAPPEDKGANIHPTRIANAYSILMDLGLVKVEVSDETPE